MFLFVDIIFTQIQCHVSTSSIFAVHQKLKYADFIKLSIETVILFRQTSLHPSPTTSPTTNHRPLLIRGTYTILLSTGKASVEAAATRSPYASATVVPGYTTVMAGAGVAMRWVIGLACMVARVARIVEATSVRYMVR